MSERCPYAIGIDVGGTKIKYACVMPEGRLLALKIIKTKAGDADWAQAVRERVNRDERGHGPAVAVGVAAPGIVSADGRSIWWMQGRLQEVQGLQWPSLLSRSSPVPVINDAQAALVAEAWIGAVQGAQDAMLLTLGTGVGGALMVDGKLLRGHLGRAGHLGHISLDADGPPDIAGTPGSLEMAIGECTLHERSHGLFTSTRDLIAASEAGNEDARQIWMRSVRALAAGIASLINVADPEVVILGGGIARAGKALLDPLQSELDRFEWRPHGRQVRLVTAKHGQFAGAIGAARNALVTK